MDGASYDVVCPLLRGGEPRPPLPPALGTATAGGHQEATPAGRRSGTSCTVDVGSVGPPPHSRRSTGITSAANRCICSSTSSVLYPPPSNHAVNMKSS